MTTPATSLTTMLTQLLGEFHAPICAAFGYGSGVLPQRAASASPADRMVDLMFVVEEAAAFHQHNMAQFPRHYSPAARLVGPQAVAWLQNRAGARTYFNPKVALCGHSVKYGVITRDALLEDLQDWRWLYAAGRLHKPVRWIREPAKDDEELVPALDANLSAALAAGLLCVGAEDSAANATFSDIDLFTTIAGLSYRGDVRMWFAEDRHKVANIVAGQALLFRQLYNPRLQRWSDIVRSIEPSLIDIGDYNADTPAAVWRLTSTHETRRFLLSQLPVHVLHRMRAIMQYDYGKLVDEPPLLRKRLLRSLARIVLSSSVRQTAMGVFTAGPVKSAMYVGRKVSKRFTV